MLYRRGFDYIVDIVIDIVQFMFQSFDYVFDVFLDYVCSIVQVLFFGYDYVYDLVVLGYKNI